MRTTVNKHILFSVSLALIVGGTVGSVNAQSALPRQDMHILANSEAVAERTEGARMRASATLHATDGTPVASAAFSQLPEAVLIELTVSNLDPGPRAVHVHETGACSPDFEAAGDHFAGSGEAHGVHSAQGPHAGDLPNIHVGADRAAKIELLSADISLVKGEPGYLFDNDGAALIIHDGVDDYRTQPSGRAGDRVACGVIELTAPAD